MNYETQIIEMSEFPFKNEFAPVINLNRINREGRFKRRILYEIGRRVSKKVRYLIDVVTEDSDDLWFVGLGFELYGVKAVVVFPGSRDKRLISIYTNKPLLSARIIKELLKKITIQAKKALRHPMDFDPFPLLTNPRK